MDKKLLILGIAILLIAVGLSGCTYQQQSVEVPNKAPIASCSANPTRGEAPLNVYFVGKGTDSDGIISSYHWDFDDGETSIEKNPTHTFETIGRYLVTFTVTDDNGATDFDVIEIVVEGETNAPPKASASADPTSGYEPLIVYFTGSGMDDNGSIVSYSWNFDDGATSTEQNPTHTFSQDGTYIVTLTVTDNGGATDSDTITIIVEKSSKFNIGETAIGEDLEVTVKSAEKTDSYTWRGEATGWEYTEHADEGKIFVIIDVKVKQIGSSSNYIYAGDFWLIDSEGNKYDHDVGTYMMDEGLEATTLYQNLQVQGKVLFEIPNHLTSLKIQFNFGTFWDPVLVEWNLNL